MATQSINLGTTTAATFNGTTVNKINLNGSQIWAAPILCSTSRINGSYTFNGVGVSRTNDLSSDLTEMGTSHVPLGDGVCSGATYTLSATGTNNSDWWSYPVIYVDFYLGTILTHASSIITTPPTRNTNNCVKEPHIQNLYNECSASSYRGYSGFPVNIPRTTSGTISEPFNSYKITVEVRTIWFGAAAGQCLMSNNVALTIN
jgi:hypothetical protein